MARGGPPPTGRANGRAPVNATGWPRVQSGPGRVRVGAGSGPQLGGGRARGAAYAQRSDALAFRVSCGRCRGYAARCVADKLRGLLRLCCGTSFG